METGPSRMRTAWIPLVLLVLAGVGLLLLRGHESTGPSADRAGERPPVEAGDGEGPPCVQSVLATDPAGPAYGAHQGQVNAYAFAADGVSMVTGGRDHALRIWDRDGLAVQVREGHRGPILDVDLARLGAGPPHVLTASSDGTARLWAPDGGAVVLRGHRGAVARARFAPDASRLLTLGLDGELRLWSATGQGGKALDHPGSALVAAAWVGSDRIMARDERDVAQLLDLRGGKVERQAKAGSIRGMHVESGASRFLLFGSDGRLLVGDLAEPRGQVLQAHDTQVLDAAFLDAEGTVASAALDGSAHVWSPEGERRYALEGHGFAVVRVVAGPGPGQCVTLAADGSARVWSAQGERVRRLAGPALRDLGVAGHDPRILWGIPRTGEGLHLWSAEGRGHGVIPLPGDGRVLDVRAAPGGARIAVRTADLRLHVILLARDPSLRAPGPHLASFREVRVLTDAPAAAAPAGPARGDYLGTAGCAACHRKEYDLWVESNHARTLEPAAEHNLPGTVLEEGVALHPPGESAFRRSDAGFVATTLGPEGTPRDYPLGWVAGRRRIRMYVAPMEDGRLQVLPAMRAELPDEWFDYTHLLFGGRDALSAPRVRPGEDAFWTGASRNWGARCARCHNSGTEPRSPLDGPLGPRATWRDLAVDCEACHGPGRAHAEAWARSATNAPLPKLGRLARQASIDACTVCHMEGEVMSAGYTHGEDLYEHLDPTLLLDPQRVDPRGRPLELIYHGLSFAVSRCAQEGALTCVRCHASHGGEHPALLGRPPTNHALCAECHVDLVRDVAGHSHHKSDGSGASCVGCHMPRLVIERGHGIITDHSISVPDPEARGDRVAQDACRWCHQFGLGSPPDVPILDDTRIERAYREWWPEAQRARAWMETLASARMGEEGADDALVALLRDPSQYLLVRASAARLLAPYATQRVEALITAAESPDSMVRRSALKSLASVRGERVDTVLRKALTDASAPVRFAAARSALEGWWRVQADAALLAAVLPVLEEDALAVPNDEMRWFRLAAARDIAGDREGAIEAYGAMVALHPHAHHARERLQDLRAGR